MVDFPQFPNIHHLIPQVLDLRPKHTTQRYYRQIEDSHKWEIYVKYREIVSRFLVDHIRRASLSTHRDPFSIYWPPPHYFAGQEHYVGLAKYLLSLLSEGL